MKLIFLNRYFHPDHSATSQLLTDLGIDQARRGREVHVITSRQLYEDPAARLAAEDEHEGVRIHRVWTSRFGRLNLAGRAIDYATFYVSAAARLFALARKDDVVVAETDPPLLSVPAAWVARRRGARLVNWLHDLFPEIARELGVRVPFAGLALSLRNYSLRAAAANVVLGELMAARVRGPAGHAPVTVIENWADGRLIRPVAAIENPLRSEWGLEGRFVVGYSGNMGRAHEFGTILDAAERLKDLADVAFLFIGGGRQKQAVLEACARRSIANVVFKPYQPLDRLAWSLSAADAHLVTLNPALEGLIVPSKFYSAAAAGRPVLFVGDTRGEIARIAEREGCGLAIRAGDADGLASAIRALRGPSGGAEAMGRRAREAFERLWDAPHGLARWDSVLPL